MSCRQADEKRSPSIANVRGAQAWGKRASLASRKRLSYTFPVRMSNGGRRAAKAEVWSASLQRRFGMFLAFAYP
jgi:hypothetical protein